MNDIAQIILCSCGGFFLLGLSFMLICFGIDYVIEAHSHYMNNADYFELRRLKEFENKIIKEKKL